jgi:serine/threonine protein kinase
VCATDLKKDPSVKRNPVAPLTLFFDRIGCYGVVKRAYDTVLSRYVAIKYVELYTDGEVGVPTCTMREIAAFARTRQNDHVVTLHDIFLTNNHVAIVMEQGGSDLWNWLLDTTLCDQGKFQTSIRICTAVASLHDSGIIHRDIKPHNILVDGDGSDPCIKLIDFGLCKIQETEGAPQDFETYTVLQSLWYRAPEVFMTDQYSTHTSKIDVWSVGCVIAQIYHGSPVIAGTSDQDHLQKIRDVVGVPQENGFRLPFTTKMPDCVGLAVTNMLQLDPEARCSIQDALAMMLPKVDAAP